MEPGAQKNSGAKGPFGHETAQPTQSFSGTVHKTETGPGCVYTSTYIVYII